jgi:hypothetical protein
MPAFKYQKEYIIHMSDEDYAKLMQECADKNDLPPNTFLAEVELCDWLVTEADVHCRHTDKVKEVSSQIRAALDTVDGDPFAPEGQWVPYQEWLK